MKKQSENSPKRAKFKCRPRAHRPAPPDGRKHLEGRRAELETAARTGASPNIVRAKAYGHNREIVIAHRQGVINPVEAAAEASAGRKILEGAGADDEPEILVVESLFWRLATRHGAGAKGAKTSKKRLAATDLRLRRQFAKAERHGAIPAGLSLKASLVWAARARTIDLDRDADGALGAARRAVYASWLAHPRHHALCVEVLRHLLQEVDEPTVAAALPRLLYTQSDQDPFLHHYVLAPELWSV